MFKQVFLFELKARLVSKATWIAFMVLVLLAFRDVMSTYWDELIGTGQVYRNSASVLTTSRCFRLFGWPSLVLACHLAAVKRLNHQSRARYLCQSN